MAKESKVHRPIGFAQLLQAVLGNDMPTSHHHRRILFCGLFLGDRTCENRVIAILRRQSYLNLCGNKSTADTFAC